MTFRKRNRFYKSKPQELHKESNETMDLLKYLANNQRNQIIESMPEKPNIRWWTRLGDEINNKFKKVIEPSIYLILFSLIIITILFSYFQDDSIKKSLNAIIYFLMSMCTITCVLLILSVIKKGYKIFQETSLIQKVKIIKKDLLSLANFLLMILFIDLTFSSTVIMILKPLIFIFQQSIISPSKELSNCGVLPRNLFYIIVPFYLIACYRILIVIIRATLQNFDKKWKYYGASVYSISLINTAFFVMTIYLDVCDQVNEIGDEVKNLDEALMIKFIPIFLIIYIVSFIDIVIAKYKIDKKFIADYEKKSKELQASTARISSYMQSKI